ncbi:uncharacterized protein FIESC28_00824 [Fusarium coffeatum]|uniref:HNH nuclease domain-containing protein n=1 Tax=Fusarium coffeatum TaxID=231269 RepID=A0A366SAU6_9HYPO|nr:uncharacterized protein FIESC28_00824 [Fusarium coffeatum]RBR26419.1 hypothetical protein FIESC28_00824 [Fusarium coffeatum]
MSDESITPAMRSHGWNLHLLAKSRAKPFAGLYQHPDNPFLKFRDLVDELRLCFHDDENWQDLAFGLDKGYHSHDFPLFVTEGDLDIVIPCLPQPDPQQRAVVKYHVVCHTGCQFAENSPLEDHIKASCASHIRLPTRRREPRYLAVDAASSNNRITRIPRHTKSRRRKRSESALSDEEFEGASEILVPVPDLLDPTKAREIVDSFREGVMLSARRCAITGEGRHWCFNQGVGPGVQTCHIVPPQHFHVYPTGVDTEDTKRHLVQAWCDTWSQDNGLLLRRDIRELFDERLISIHPDTHRIRDFVPYDVILHYHGLIARIPGIVDRDALAHHYEMTCIESIAAEMPTPESITAEFNRYFGIGDSSASTASPDSSASMESYITPENSRQFLADVNSKLENLQR